MNGVSIDLFLMPLVGMIIGWYTNVLAVRMLFRPLKPLRLPGFPWAIQGVIPKRQGELAEKIGEVVENQLFSPQDLLTRVNSAENRYKLVCSLADVVAGQLGNRLPLFLPPGVRQILSDSARELVMKEAPAVLNQMGDRINHSIQENVPIKAIVEEKVRNFELAHFEAIVLKVAGKELRYIEVFGGVLGFCIGLVQAMLSWFLRV
ncbi:MAG: DUF445 family protein [Heliobacteriaceae bacterium]|nr:DUF445 family protein [Heliobacteriaceae bacterium]MDD4587603.1 DUF445 family protein [Heliobacteriaceae bacterium]